MQRALMEFRKVEKLVRTKIQPKSNGVKIVETRQTFILLRIVALTGGSTVEYS